MPDPKSGNACTLVSPAAPREAIDASAPPPLSADLAIYIPDPTVTLLLARIQQLRDIRNIQGTESGLLDLTAIDVLHGKWLRDGNVFAVPFARAADPMLRPMNARDRWNALNLEPGSLLLLAVRGYQNPTGIIWFAEAADHVAAPDDTPVHETRQAARIEYDMPAERRTFELQAALLTGKDVLLRYALEALTNRALVPRPQAVEMVAKAIESPNVSPDDKLTVAVALATGRLFSDSSSPDTVDAKIVSIIASALVAENDPRRRGNWVRVLSSRILKQFSEEPDQDSAARLGLIRAIRTPPPATVITVLQAQSTVGSEGLRQFIQKLADTWQEAVSTSI